MVKLCRFLIFFLILSVALVIWRGNRTAIEIKDVIVQTVCLVIIGVSALNLLFKDKISIKKEPLIILTVLYGLFMTAAYLHTSRCSLNDSALMPQLFGIITFMLVVCYFDQRDIKKLTFFAVTGAVISSCYGILQFFHMDPLKWENIGASGTLRVVSFFGNKNYFALYLLLMIPLGGYIALTSKKKAAIFAGIFSAALMTAALAISYSKGAMIAFFLSAMAGTALLLLKKSRTAAMHSKKMPLLFIIPIAMVLMIALLSEDIRRDYAKRMITYRQYYTTQRLSFYLAAAEVIGRHPFFGTGPGNFPLAYPHNTIYKVKAEDPNDVLTHVHNDFLEIWAEYGVFSFLAYLGVLAVFIYEWGKAFQRADEPKRQGTLILFFCALTGYICYSLMTVAGRYMSSVFYFWLVMGMGYLYLKGDQDTEKSVLIPNPLKKNRKILWVIGVGIILIFGLTCKKILANYVSDVYMNKAYRLASQRNYNSALKCLNTAIALYPKSVEAYYQRGFVYFSKGLTDRAIEDYEKVIQMAPNYVNVYLNMASCFYRKKDWANTVRMASISYRLFPDYLPNLMTLAYCYYYMGKPQTSRMYYERIPERYKDLPQVLQLRQKLEKIFNKKEEEDYGKNAEFDHSNISRNDGSCAYLPGRYSG